MSIQFYWPFFNQVAFVILSFKNCLYMLDIDLLLVISLTDIFSHSVPCLFILWMVSLAVKKFPVSFRRCGTLLQSHASVPQGHFSNQRIQRMGIYTCWAHSSHSSCCVPAVLLWSHQGGKHRCGGDAIFLVRSGRETLGRLPGVGELWLEICRMSGHQLIKLGRRGM